MLRLRDTSTTATLVLGLAFALVAAQSHGASTPRGVIFILLDDVGSESIGAYNSSIQRTPNIDALAKNGLQLVNFISNPSCTPSRASLVSGRYPYRHRLTRNTKSNNMVHKDCIMGRAMKAAGYTTFQAGKWQLTSPSKPYLVSQMCGFDYHVTWDHRDNRYLYSGFHTNLRHLTTESAGQFTFGTAYSEETFDTQETNHVFPEGWRPYFLTRLTKSFIKSRTSEEKFFVFYPVLEVHTPLTHPPDSTESKQFDALLASVDKQIGELVALLETQGIADEVLVIVASDNGARSSHTDEWGPNHLPVEGGKLTLSDAGIRMPFVLNWQNHTRKRTTSPALVDTTDVLPTILEAIGTDTSHFDLDGQSFWQFARGTTARGPRTWVASQQGQRFDVRTANLAYGTDRSAIESTANRFQPRPVNQGAPNDVCAQPEQLKLLNVMADYATSATLELPTLFSPTAVGACSHYKCNANRMLVCDESSDSTSTTDSSNGSSGSTHTTTKPSSSSKACGVRNCQTCQAQLPSRCAVCKAGFTLKEQGALCKRLRKAVSRRRRSS
eukprot:m.26244 g.26244  ORF g.26244 m.26244 type:complete len:554 (+) comp8807_c0_seq3:79-1740(+)